MIGGGILARRKPPAIRLEPASAYEAVTRQMVEDLLREMALVRQRVDTLFWLLVGSLALDLLLRLRG